MTLTTELAELYHRQNLLDIHPPDKVTVIGCGGTGFWVALQLATSGVPELFLMDGDYLELSNGNRLLMTSENVGANKAQYCSDFIRQFRPDCQTHIYPHADKFLFGTTEGLVFDCTDRFSTQQHIQAWAAEARRTYIRDGYDGLGMTVTNTLPQWTTNPALDADTGYEQTPSWIVPALLASAFGVYKALYQPNFEVAGYISQAFPQVQPRRQPVATQWASINFDEQQHEEDPPRNLDGQTREEEALSLFSDNGICHECGMHMNDHGYLPETGFFYTCPEPYLEPEPDEEEDEENE